MEKELFADVIGDVKFENGVFRIDLVSISPTKLDKDKKPVFEFKQRIIMPPEGFLKSFSTMEKSLKILIERGILKKAEVDKEIDPKTHAKWTPPSFS